MLLASIVRGLDFVKIKGDLEIEVSNIAYDSREVMDNSIFVAISGYTVDGHQFIEKAIEMGATTIIIEKDVSIKNNVTVLKVSDSRKALAKISSNYYYNPTKKLDLVGITGTNGKTSTAYFIKSIYEQADKSVGLIGTIGTIIDNKIIKNKNTTPESLNLQQIFYKMVKSNIKHCIMEVSSHALCLNRVAYSSYNTNIFTNLSPDHLELHKNMDNYYHAKAKLFEITKDYNIINIDDEYGRKLAEKIINNDAKLITYGIVNNADIYASDIHYSAEFTTYDLHTPTGNIAIKVNLPGMIYVYNSLAAIACAYSNNISFEDIQKGIAAIDRIKGRFEVVYKDNDYKIIIDFAHTEDGLVKALTTLRSFSKGRIILVFGVYAAVGEQGREKRRAMGKIAANFSDFAIVTSDNPKEQDPLLIIEEIVEAIEEEKGYYKAIVDREEAITYALEMSKKDDTILIAGKGHETTQIIGDKEIPFNEAEIVAEFIKSKQLVNN